MRNFVKTIRPGELLEVEPGSVPLRVLVPVLFFPNLVFCR